MIWHSISAVVRAAVLCIVCAIETTGAFPFITFYLYAHFLQYEKNVFEHFIFVCIMVLILGITTQLPWLMLSIGMCVYAASGLWVQTSIPRSHTEKMQAVGAIVAGCALGFYWHSSSFISQWLLISAYALLLFFYATWSDTRKNGRKIHNWLSLNQ